MDNNISVYKKVIFYGNKIDKLLTYLFSVGVIVAIVITIFEYRLNLNQDKEYIYKLFILPAGVTLSLGVIIALLRVIYESIGLGDLKEIKNIVIELPTDIRFLIQSLYIIACTIFMLTGGYTFAKIVIGVHIKLIKLLM